MPEITDRKNKNNPVPTDSKSNTEAPVRAIREIMVGLSSCEAGAFTDDPGKVSLFVCECKLTTQRQLGFCASFCRPLRPRELRVWTRRPAVDHSVACFVCQHVRLNRPSGGDVPGAVASAAGAATGRGSCAASVAFPTGRSLQQETEPLSGKLQSVCFLTATHLFLTRNKRTLTQRRKNEK